MSLTRLNERSISRVRQRLDDGEVPERPILDSNLNLIARPGNDLCGVCTMNVDAVDTVERGVIARGVIASVTQKRIGAWTHMSER